MRPDDSAAMSLFYRTSLVHVATGLLQSCFLLYSLLTTNVLPASGLQEEVSVGELLQFSVQPAQASCVTAGAPALLHCAVRGMTHRAASVHWLKDDVMLEPDDRRSVMSNGTLLLEGVDPARDEGGYQCVVSALPLGAIVSRRALLSVAHQAPSITAEPQSLALRTGDTAMFACTARMDCGGARSVRWFRYEEELTSSALTSSSRHVIHHSAGGAGGVAVDDVTSVLEVRAVLAADFGHYKCRVESARGGIKYSAFAQLSQDDSGPSGGAPYQTLAPWFVMRPRDVTALEGATVLLVCAANGRDRHKATPRVGWLRNGASLDLGGSDGRFSLVGVGSLRISGVQSEDSGVYTCRAFNAEDSADAEATLTVLVPPIIPIPPLSLSTPLHSDVNLSCPHVGGVPPPRVHWFKDGGPLAPGPYLRVEEGGRRLRVLGVGGSDVGVYQCVAVSRVGSAQAGARVIVIPPLEGASHDLTPPAPNNLTVVVTSARSVGLLWQPPEQLPGSLEISGYLVEWGKEGEERRQRMMNTTATQTTIEDLWPDTKYWFHVKARDSGVWPGRPGAQVFATTPSEPLVPDPPVDLRADPLTPTSVKLTWVEPTRTHGSIVIYKVHYRAVMGGGAMGGAAGSDVSMEEEDVNVVDTFYTFAELAHFQLYMFRVVAYNVNGSGEGSEEVSCRTHSDVPSQPPQHVSAEATSSKSVLVRWEAPPVDALNGIITGYKLRFRAGVEREGGEKIWLDRGGGEKGWGERGRGERGGGEVVTVDGSRRMYELTDLQKAAEYSVRVAAMTVNGTGPYSVWVSARTLGSELDESMVPGQPTYLRIRPSSNSVLLTWTSPADARVKVQGYILGYGIGIPDVYRQILDARHRYHTVKALSLWYVTESNCEYVISLRAYNNVGEGEPIYETVLTREQPTPEPPAPLMPPVGLRALVDSPTSVLLSWSDTPSPPGGGGSLWGSENIRGGDSRYYTVRYNPKLSRKPRLLNVSDLEVRLDDLKVDMEYEFNVKVVRGQRQSAWSLSVFNRTREATPSSSPRDLTLIQVEGRPMAASLSWQPPRHSNGLVTGYLVCYTTDPTVPDSDWMVEGVLGDWITTTLRELSPDTTYYFRIQARNAAGYGPMSPTVIYRTPNGKGLGGGMLEDFEQSRRFVALNRNVQDDAQDGAGGFPPFVLWVVIAGVGGVAVVAMVIGIICFRYNANKNQPAVVNQEVAKSGSSGQLKPPDLWTHDQGGLGRGERDPLNPSSDQSTFPRSLTYAGNDLGAADVHGEDGRCRRLGVRPTLISVDDPPLPTEPLSSLLPMGSLVSADQLHYLSRGAGACLPPGGAGPSNPRHPPYPRTQYTSTPRVNAGDLCAQAAASDQAYSSLERHRILSEVSKRSLGSNPRLTAADPPGGPPPAYEPRSALGPGGASVPCRQTPPLPAADGRTSLPHRMTPRGLRGAAGTAGGMGASPPRSPAVSPRPRRIVRPTQLQTSASSQAKLHQSSAPSQAAVKGSAAPQPSAPPSHKDRPPLPPLLSGSSEHLSTTSTHIPKSLSSEELTAEIASLEGLMKDLSAIQQHDFNC